MSSGGADKENTRLEAFTSASESESGASTDSAAIVQDMLSMNSLGEGHVKLALHRTQTPPAERLALHSVSRLAARTMPACPTTALARGEPTQKQKKLADGSSSVVKRGCRKCAACHKYHHWKAKCNGLVLSPTPTPFPNSHTFPQLPQSTPTPMVLVTDDTVVRRGEWSPD